MAGIGVYFDDKGDYFSSDPARRLRELNQEPVPTASRQGQDVMVNMVMGSRCP